MSAARSTSNHASEPTAPEPAAPGTTAPSTTAPESAAPSRPEPDAAGPRPGRRGTATDLAQIAVFAALIAALGLPGALYLGGTAVPITFQTLGVMLAGAILGARKGFLSVLLFLALVAAGLPLLSGRRGGLAVFVGPSVGYLVGWLLGVVVIGWFTARLLPRYPVLPALGATALGGIVAVYLSACPCSPRSPRRRSTWRSSARSSSCRATSPRSSSPCSSRRACTARRPASSPRSRGRGVAARRCRPAHERLAARLVARGRPRVRGRRRAVRRACAGGRRGAAPTG